MKPKLEKSITKSWLFEKTTHIDEPLVTKAKIKREKTQLPEAGEKEDTLNNCVSLN